VVEAWEALSCIYTDRSRRRHRLARSMAGEQRVAAAVEGSLVGLAKVVVVEEQVVRQSVGETSSSGVMAEEQAVRILGAVVPEQVVQRDLMAFERRAVA